MKFQCLYLRRQPLRWHALLTKVMVLVAVTALLFSPRGVAQTSEVTTLSAETPKEVLEGTAAFTGHYDPNQMLRLTIGLRPPNILEEQQFLRDVQSKGSPQFHHFLTAEQWNARFAPSAQDEQAVVDWARSENLTVTNRFPNRLIVDLEGPMGAIEEAFNVKMNSYQLGEISVYSNDRDPAIPARLASIIQSVDGLNNIQVLRPSVQGAQGGRGPVYVPGPVVAVGESAEGTADRTKLPAGLAGRQVSPAPPPITNGRYDPTDLYGTNAYDYQALYNQGHCCNPLGNPGQSPPESSIAIATAYALNLSDMAGFQSQYPYLAYNVQLINIDGTPTCPTNPPVPNCNLETTLDVEWATAMSNSFGPPADTARIWVYQGANPTSTTFHDIFEQILTDGHARVLSTSWGCAEISCYARSSMSTDDAIFSQMVGQGWTLVAASDDSGATAWLAPKTCSTSDAVEFPSSDPNVVAVGGTLLKLNFNGTYNSEAGWTGGTSPGSCGNNNGGSGGGCSIFFTQAPDYQTNFPCGQNSRGLPDIALNAANPQNIYFNGSLTGAIGTSIAAPEMAGFFAQENAYLDSDNLCNGSCAPMGNANYYLYKEGIHADAPYSPFYDITSGCNSNDVTAANNLNFFCAGPGYDLVTGWGSANMLHLAWAINWYLTDDIGPLEVDFSGPPRNQWYNTNQIVNWNIFDRVGSSFTLPAGFSSAWDAYPDGGAVLSEPTPGCCNNFYDGPQVVNTGGGSLDLDHAMGQGCHTANVVAWNNAGLSSLDQLYGPICFDTVPPRTKDTLVGKLNGKTYESEVEVTLSANDPAPGSGVAKTVYQDVAGQPPTTYTGPFMISSAGDHVIRFHSTDVAGNVESTQIASFTITSPTTTALSSSANPSRSGKPVTFTAIVTPELTGTPTGSVTFKNGATVLGTHTLSGGKTTFVTSTLPGGSDTIIATYNGGAYFNGSSASLTEKIETSTATTTTLTSSPNPSQYGQSAIFTASISFSGSGTPTGTVTFKNGSVTLGTGKVSDGKAFFAISTLAVGVHSITAIYSGDSQFTGSTSTALKQQVTKANSSITLNSSQNPSTSGQPVTFTTVVASSTTGTPTGTVNFSDGTQLLGSHTLSGGVAALTTSKLSTGTHSIIAAYAGSADFNTSNSSVLTQTVNP